MPKRFLQEGDCYHVVTATRGRKQVFAIESKALILLEAIEFLRPERRALVLAFAIMPDHLHILLVPQPPNSLPDVIRAMKGYSSRQINRTTGSKGSLWQQSYFDRGIRSEEQLRATIDYIEGNAMKDGIVSEIENYRFSSGHPDIKTDLETFLGGEP